MAKKTIRSSVVDTANITKEYWEKVLETRVLAWHADESIKHLDYFGSAISNKAKKLGELRRRDVPVGNSTDLEIVEKMLQIARVGAS